MQKNIESKPVLKLDKLKLKDNNLIYSSFYLFGAYLKEDIDNVKYRAIQALKETGREYKVIYDGTVTGIKPYKLERVLDSPPSTGKFKGTEYLNYLNPNPAENPHLGIPLMDSYTSVIKLYQNKFGYFPAYVLILQIKNK